MRWIAALFVTFLVAPASAQDSARTDAPVPLDNPLLRRLFDEDQDDRKTGTIDADMAKRDAQRREQVLGELRSGRLRNANDYYRAAMVFQHGESADEIRLAFSLAWTSAQMGGKKKDRALWLSAAAWDRIMMRLQKPQWYGTQHAANDAGSEFSLYQIDEDAVTDQERTRMNVPVLSEAKKRVELVNKRFGKKRLRNESDEHMNEPEDANPVESSGKSPARDQ